MDLYEVTFRGSVVRTGDDSGPALVDPEELDAHLSEVMEELLNLAARDATVGSTLVTGEVEVSISVEADSVEDATRKGIGTIRAAVHATGASTAGWDVDWVANETTRIVDDLIDA